MTDMRKFMMLVERVFHGTPQAGIEKFDTKHIGAGEGHQAYGWGLYFASERQVAEFYQKGLTQRNSGRFPSWLTNENAPKLQQRLRMEHISDTPAMEQAIVLLSWYVAEYHTYDEVMDFINDLPNEPLSSDVGPVTPENSCTKADIMKLAIELYIPANKGALYTLEIPDKSEFLLWDEPLYGQSAWVQKVLRHIFLSDLLYEDDTYRDIVNEVTGRQVESDFEGEYSKDSAEEILDEMTGEEFYQCLCKLATIKYHNTGNPKQQASMMLLKAKIHGIKYKDQFTRAGGAGTYNYVIFDGATAKVVKQE